MKTALLTALFAALAACSTPAPSTSTGGMPFRIEHVTEAFDGTAAEVLQVPSYTYVAVKTEGGAVRWAVSLKKKIAEGARVHVRSFGRKTDFHSHKLDRVFPELSFAIVTVR